MPYIHPATLDYERKRWLRPNANRFMRADWRRFIRPASECAVYFESIERKYSPAQPSVPRGNPGGGQWTSEGVSDGGPSVTMVGALPKTPQGTDVEKNIKEAESHKRNIFWFYSKVHNGGPWDYKQINKDYADFGNFNYGATGRAAEFSEDTLLRMAGWAQVQAGTSRPDWGVAPSLPEAMLGIGGRAPFGDDPIDQQWISRGIRYYENVFRRR